jgi:hypothetical protein
LCLRRNQRLPARNPQQRLLPPCLQPAARGRRGRPRVGVTEHFASCGIARCCDNQCTQLLHRMFGAVAINQRRADAIGFELPVSSQATGEVGARFNLAHASKCAVPLDRQD